MYRDCVVLVRDAEARIRVFGRNGANVWKTIVKRAASNEDLARLSSQGGRLHRVRKDGRAEATRIAAAAHPVIGYDIIAARGCRKFSDMLFAESVALVAAEEHVTVTSLPDTAVVDAIARGPK